MPSVTWRELPHSDVVLGVIIRCPLVGTTWSDRHGQRRSGMNARESTCSVVGCLHAGRWEIVWTNDSVYVVCENHSDSILRPGVDATFPDVVAPRPESSQEQTTSRAPTFAARRRAVNATDGRAAGEWRARRVATRS
jgi:hypothetical protein